MRTGRALQFFTRFGESAAAIDNNVAVSGAQTKNISRGETTKSPRNNAIKNTDDAAASVARPTKCLGSELIQSSKNHDNPSTKAPLLAVLKTTNRLGGEIIQSPKKKADDNPLPALGLIDIQVF